MEVVPRLINDGPTVVSRIPAGSGLVETRTSAANVWRGTISLGQRCLHVAKSVRRGIAWSDACGCEPAPGRKTAIVHDGCLEELDDFLVLNV